MVNPTRFPAGISTFPVQNVLNTFPTVPSQYQINRGDDFIPYSSGSYTATASTGAASANYSWNGGALKITGGTSTPFKSFLALGSGNIQIVPGNQSWHDVRMGVPTGSMKNPLTDSVVYSGFFDNADPASATNGIYFVKPAGGSVVNFVILKNSTATTFSNVADFAVPSGIYGDTASTAGTLTFNSTGTTFSSIAVGSAGAGYRVAPLCIPFGTAGSGAQVSVQLGGATQGGGTVGSSLYAPYILAAGSSYTAGTLGCDVIPFINLQFWYNGAGSLFVGVNGRSVLSLSVDGTATATPGSTYSLGAGLANSYNFAGTSLSTSVAPVQPYPGGFYSVAPQVPLQLDFGLIGTSGNARYLYVEEINIGTEVN